MNSLPFSIEICFGFRFKKKMYNGIGLTTPRGTGTNGYVQRNLSHVPVKRERVEYVKDVELKRLEKLIEKKGNAEILEHERKRKIEVKCMEMREMMLNTGSVCYCL